MALNILDKFGLKEVFDVTWYKIAEGGGIGAPVLYSDTLKVSTVEQTAENVSARGGKGNTELVTWDFNKEITLNFEDALFSAKSLAIMFGSVTKDGDADIDTTAATIYHTVPKSKVINAAENTCKVELRGAEYQLSDVKYYKADGTEATASGSAPTDYAYAVGMLPVADSMTIEINPDTFPGAYYISGWTYRRREDNLEDEIFNLIVPKAKMLSEVTLEASADGDPSTFSMQMKVLRPASGPMMKLVLASLTEAE